MKRFRERKWGRREICMIVHTEERLSLLARFAISSLLFSFLFSSCSSSIFLSTLLLWLLLPFERGERKVKNRKRDDQFDHGTYQLLHFSSSSSSHFLFSSASLFPFNTLHNSFRHRFFRFDCNLVVFCQFVFRHIFDKIFIDQQQWSRATWLVYSHLLSFFFSSLRSVRKCVIFFLIDQS